MINRENPYYIGKHDANVINLTEEQLSNMRKDAVYVWNIIAKLISSKGSTSVITPDYRKQILSGKLLNSDSKIRIYRNTGEKLKALFIALDKEENRKVFCNSYFYTASKVLTTGHLNAEDKAEWVNYKLADTHEDLFKNKNPLLTALYCYQKEKHMPVGLNLDAFLDTIIKKDLNGNYVVADTNAEQGDLLAQAVFQHVNDMKNNERFKLNFKNQKLEEMENDDEENE